MPLIRVATLVAATCLLAACATLPSSGPTVGQIEKAASNASKELNFRIIEIDAETIKEHAIRPEANSDALGALAAITPIERSETIRKGDLLTISIYEIGVTLFANSLPPQAHSANYPAAGAHILSRQVDESGQISLPYIGSLQVDGMSPDQASRHIEARMRSVSQSPAVAIAITETVENVVFISGAVTRPGRYRLTAAHERLLDVVALAGGTSIDVNDAELRLTRADKSVIERLGQINNDSISNIVINPGDRIEIKLQPRTFTVFGATDKISQIPFSTPSLSLAEAVARAGGPSDERANPTGVFLFRFEPAQGAAEEHPIVYQLDLMRPASYFFAQRFEVRDKDVLYFANAAMNPPSKFINLLNQLFSPIVTARVLTK